MLALRTVSIFLFAALLLQACGEPRVLRPEVGPPPQLRPTQPPRLQLGGSDVAMSMRFPGDVQRIDLAVHPNTGWPAVVAVEGYDYSTEPFRVYARVYNPKANRWGAGQQIDVGESSLGRKRQPIPQAVVAVTADDTVHVVWGSAGVRGGIWTSESYDYGDTWSKPVEIAPRCWFATSIAATPDGQLVVLASCSLRDSDPDGLATLIVRQADGIWQQPAYLPVWGWCGTVVLAGDGRDALASALVTSHAAGTTTETMTVISKYLVNPHWETTTIPIPRPASSDSARQTNPGYCNFRSLTFPRHYEDGTVRTGAMAVWTEQSRAQVWAITSFADRLQWGRPELVVNYPGLSAQTGKYVTHAVPAYDVVADRLVIIWNCCGWFNRKEAATQYSHWSVPRSGRWHASIRDTPQSTPDPAPKTPVPLVLGGQRVGPMVSQIASNSRKMWIAWLEQRQELIVRSFELNQLIPISEYPDPTPHSRPEAP